MTAIAHLVALIARVMDNIMCVVVNITHVAAEKAVEEARNFVHFLKFLGGFSMVKIQSFSKSAKKWSSF